MFYIDEICKGVKTIGITGHIHPDGDCVGSTLGLYNYISENMPEIKVDIFLEPIAPEFLFLKNSDKISQEVNDKEYDLFFVLDGAGLDRFEPFNAYFHNAKQTVMIDHHMTGQKIGTYNLIEPKVSSCCEVLFGILDEAKISKNVAECLYLGMIHDTGVFKYQAVNAKTMQTAGALMEKGINFTKIIDDTFYSRTYKQTQVLGKALLESIMFCNGKCIFSIITKKEMEFYGVNSSDLGGVVEQLRLNDTVEVAVFMYENEKDQYKVSLRSKNYIDVSKIAKQYGGGGHIRAAGFTMSAVEPRDIINNVGLLIEQQMNAEGKCITE